MEAQQTLSVLIVDDHEGMCLTLKDILEESGYRAETALCGREAIDICGRQTFDLIMLDVRMPDINGVEVFRELKNRAVNARVIMMSAYSAEELKKDALEEGAIAFLQKPVDVDFVLKLIQQQTYSNFMEKPGNKQGSS